MPSCSSSTGGHRRRTILRLALLAGPAGAALSACAAPGAGLPPLPETRGGSYNLGPEDELRVTVFNDPRLTGDFRVSDTGALALPLVGSVRAAGLTTTDLERSVEREMARKGLFRDPNVAVQVTKYRPIFVLGMAERPGQYPYQPGMTVLTAVAVAGGFNYRAVQNVVSVTRIGEDGQAREYRAGRDALLQPGDVVNLFERRF